MTATISMIAAVADNGVIGAGGEMPWRLPTDFAFFKKTTMGKPLIMGRKTFESIGKPLPGRINIVISSRRDYQPEGVIVVASLNGALDQARGIAAVTGADEIFIAGGGHVYAEAMPLARRLYITHVHASPEGDTVFPAIDPEKWTLAEDVAVQPTDKDSAEFSIKVYSR